MSTWETLSSYALEAAAAIGTIATLVHGRRTGWLRPRSWAERTRQWVGHQRNIQTENQTLKLEVVELRETLKLERQKNQSHEAIEAVLRQQIGYLEDLADSYAEPPAPAPIGTPAVSNGNPAAALPANTTSSSSSPIPESEPASKP